MGGRFGSSSAAAGDDSQRAFIDEGGNLRQPARQLELRSVTGTGTLAAGTQYGDLEAAEAGPPPWWHLRTCFPDFRWCSVLGIIVFLQLVVYLISCWVVTPRQWVQPNGLALWKLGSSDHFAERCARVMGGKSLIELRRLFVPIFLHNGVAHIMFNLFFELTSGSRSLDEHGPLAFFVLFFVSGICGNLLSDAFNVNGVGASTSCYGLIGAEMAKILLVWPTQDENWRAPVRQWLSQTVGMLMLWEIINWSTIDHFGHGGGLVGGLCIAMILTPVDTLSLDAIKYRRIATMVLAGGVGFCVVKIFYWGDSEETEYNGNKVKWTDLCTAMRSWYSQTS